MPFICDGGKDVQKMHLVQFTNNLDESVTQGDVLIIGHRKALLSHHASMGNPVVGVEVADTACDTRVCGIVFEAYAVLSPESLIPPGMEQESSSQHKGKHKASKASKARQLSMQVYSLKQLEKLDRAKVKPGQLGYMVTHGVFASCKVDADITPIKVGDLLTTSPTKGHAQKVLEPTEAIGAILGKALASLKEGKGTIPILVMIQ
jgi:hypothetical protein